MQGQNFKYPECTKGECHVGEVLNMICLEPKCIQKSVICGICYDEEHRNHKIRPLKLIINNSKKYLQGLTPLALDAEKVKASIKTTQSKLIASFDELQKFVTESLANIRLNINAIFIKVLDQVQLKTGKNDQLLTALEEIKKRQMPYDSFVSLMQKLIAGVPLDVEEDEPQVSGSDIEQAVTSIQTKLQKDLKTKQIKIKAELEGFLTSLQKTADNPSIFDGKIDFKFSSEMKHAGITLVNQNTIKSTEGYNYHFSLMEPSLNEKGNRPCRVAFKIKENTSSWLAVGVCYKNAIVNANYTFNYSSLGHGAYLVSSNGGKNFPTQAHGLQQTQLRITQSMRSTTTRAIQQQLTTIQLKASSFSARKAPNKATQSNSSKRKMTSYIYVDCFTTITIRSSILAMMMNDLQHLQSMFEQLLKGISQSSQNNRNASDGWDEPPIRVNRTSQEKKQSETPAFLSKIGGLGVYVEEYDSEQDQPAIEINASVEQSNKNSQVLSINEIGNNCDEGHPMIISQIDNRVEINNQFVKKIKISAFQLRQLCIELAEYLDEQRHKQQELKYKMIQQLADITRKMVSSSQRKPIDSPCNKCQQLKRQMNLLMAQKNKIQQDLQSVTFQKDRLQEQTFDMQQKMYGIDLQVQKRLKEKEKNRNLLSISPIPEQTKEIIEHLQQEITSQKDKLKNYEAMLQSMPSKDQIRDLKEREKDLQKRQVALRQQLTHLQQARQASYQRQHEILLAEENLSKKIAQIRKKQAQLSQWEAEIARRKREDRTVHRDNTLAQQFPSNDPSFQHSAEELNNSRQMSLKSFGKNPHLEQKQGFSPSSEELDLQTFYKPRTQADQEIRNRRQPNIQPQNYPLLDGRKYKPSESNYIPKARRDNLQPGLAKRYNPQISSYSREASPYRVLNQPARVRQGAQMYQLPRNSPGHFKQISKNSRSTSKSKVGALVQSQLAARNQKDNQLGGLGSKLERLREEIKRQIDSIK